MREYNRQWAFSWAEAIVREFDPTVTVQTFDDKPKKDPKLARIFTAPMSQVWDKMLALNERGCGVFLTIAETDGKGRKKTNFKRARAAWADIDGVTECPELPLKPTALTRTRNGFQPIWALPADNTLSGPQLEDLNKRIAHHLGADRKSVDCTRVLRFPGLYHCKEDPFEVQLLELHEDEIYTVAQLEAAFAPIPEEQPEPPPYQPPPRSRADRGLNTPYGKAGLHEEERRVRCAVKGDRNNTLNAAAYSVAQLVAGGELDHGTARSTLEAAAVSIGLSANEAKQTIDSGFRAGLVQPRTAPARGHLQLAQKIEPPPDPIPFGADDDVPEAEREWRDDVVMRPSRYGPKLAKVPGNISIILTHDPRWAGCLRFDEFANKIRWCSPPPVLGTMIPPEGELADHHITYIQHWLTTTYAVNFSREDVMAAVSVASQANPIHPVREYLNGLEWDGKPRLETWLADHCEADTSGINGRIGRWWLIAAVARVFQPGCQADYTLILEGRQGAKKSSLVRVLAGQEWFQATLGDLRSKEGAQSLQGYWLIELGELDAFRGAAATRIKDFLTQTTDRYRPTYGRYMIDRPRQCVFVGTTNEKQYLTDTTGNRRFWPVGVGDIDVAGLAENRDQLWAEATHAYKQGERWWPAEADEECALSALQEDRSQIDPWYEPLQTLCSNRTIPLSTEDLMNAVDLDKDRWDRAAQTRIGAIMHVLEWPRKRRRDKNNRPVWRYHPPTDQGEFFSDD